MSVIYSTFDIPYNQRAWIRQRHNPTPCQYCKKPIVFMKNIHGTYVACDAIKKIVNADEGDIRIMQEDGMVSRMDRRVGWPVHECPAKQ